MHQGNLKLGPDGALVALDFGIMGRIDAYTRRVYAEILFGFLRRDYHRVAEVHFEAGYVPRRPRPRRLRPGAALGRRADLRAGRHADLDGAAARAPLRGDRAVRDADPHRADPAAADDGRGRGRGAQPQPGDEHVGDRAAGGHRLHPLQPRARRGGARPRRRPCGSSRRFGPRLPQLAEAALVRANAPRAGAGAAEAARAGPMRWAARWSGRRWWCWGRWSAERARVRTTFRQRGRVVRRRFAQEFRQRQRFTGIRSMHNACTRRAPCVCQVKASGLNR